MGNDTYKIMEAVMDYLSEDGWDCMHDRARNEIHMVVDLESGITIPMRFALEKDEPVIVCIGVLPLNIPKEKTIRQSIAEYICAANYGFPLGAGIQFDVLGDGKIIYSECIQLIEGVLPKKEEVIATMVVICMVFDMYVSGIKRVLLGERPEDVIADIEKM